MSLLTVPEAAAVLKCSDRFVLDELRRKNLRGIKLTGRAGWRIETADIETYKASKANVRPVRKSA